MGSKRLGIYWGEEKITLLETDGGSPSQIAVINVASSHDSSPFRTELTEDIQISSSIQGILKKDRFNTNEVSLSLPLKDYILRSFIIPLVKPNELTGIIEFEARKYIPFDLKEVAYVYHVVPIVQNKIKRFRVIFYGVRKEILERYARILKQAGLTITFCEPSAVSLAKGFIAQQYVKLEDSFGFIEIQEKIGRIIFFDKGIAQFIREFSLTIPTNLSEENLDEDLVQYKIFNEIRASIDFYKRQFEGVPIGDFLAPETGFPSSIKHLIEEEFNCKLKPISMGVRLARLSAEDSEGFFAYGAALNNKSLNFPLLNFIQKKTSKPGGVGSISFEFNLADYKPVFVAALAVGVALIAAFIFGQNSLRQYVKQINALNLQLGEKVNVSTDEILAQIGSTKKKSSDYKNIQFKSEFFNVMMGLYSRMPSGMWLKNLKVMYQEGEDVFKKLPLKLEITGFVYHQDSNQQMRQVNDFVSTLKKDKMLSAFFKNVDLVSVKRSDDQSNSFTIFNIICF